jgi:hypothetical protein
LGGSHGVNVCFRVNWVGRAYGLWN